MECQTLGPSRIVGWIYVEQPKCRKDERMTLIIGSYVICSLASRLCCKMTS